MNSRRAALCLSIAFSMAISLLAPARARADSAELLNFAPDDAKALTAALHSVGLEPATARFADSLPAMTKLVVLNSKDRLNAAQEKAIGSFVDAGGSLLVVMGNDHCGRDAFDCGFMLPTMAWAWHDTVEGPFVASTFESEVLGSQAAEQFKSLTVPYAHTIQPFSALERGQTRYDEFDREVLDKEGVFVPVGTFLWSRPLINRDWHIQLRAGGDREMPLLITGRYGKGRTAVFAAGAEALDGTPSGEAFWQSVLKWLAQTDPPAPAIADTLPEPVVTVDAAKRMLSIELTNPNGEAAAVSVLGRVMTWEPALIGDVQKAATIPANGKITVELPLPPVNDQSYAAIADRDVFEVRLGVMSADGSKLLNESRVHADLRPPLLATLHTDDVRKYQWPFGMAPAFDPASRMGIFVGNYAYKPGETIHAQLVLDNGTRNIARFAKAADETTPDNPTAEALNDGFAMSEHPSSEYLHAAGEWIGTKGDNIVTFTFPHTVKMDSIVLIGAASTYRNLEKKNPASVIVQIDGKEVAVEAKLAERFLAENGRVRLDFAPVTGTAVQLQLGAPGGGSEAALGDVEIWGALNGALPAAVSLDASAVLRDAFSGAKQPAVSKKVEIASGGHATVDFDLPTPKNTELSFLTIDVSVGGQTVSTPVMTIDPHKTLLSMESLKGTNVGDGFIVTRGFRNVFTTGTGTREIPPGAWATPDDLAWAYAHGLKENGDNSKYSAAKLYVTDNDMRHYSTQWRHFLDGEEFYDVATPSLLANYEKKPGWKDADVALMGHSDRWDSGPPVEEQYAWQEFIAFDNWLQAKKLGHLTGKTKKQLVAEIKDKYSGPWSAYQLENYRNNVAELRKAFADAGKRLLITAQGCPLVPPAFAEAICDVIRGTSDDSTWGQVHNDAILTTGRQMGALAFNPYLQMSTLAHWGHNSASLNNQQWHGPIGTTEPSRRNMYDRAFRGTIRMDGTYTSIHTYGYNSNVGDSFTLTDVDYAQWNRARTLHTFLLPESAIGAGLVIGNSYLSNPASTHFAADPAGATETQAVMRSLGLLERAGVSVPYSANALSLEKWKGTSPLVVLNLQKFTPEEINILRSTLARGVHVAALYSGSEDSHLSPDAASLFGVDVDGKPAAGGKVMGTIGSGQIISKDNALFIPLDPMAMDRMQVDSIAPLLIDQLKIPVSFGAGSTGYGFLSNGRQFIVVEDWAEIGRVIQLRLKSDSASLAAINVNDHASLLVKREGTDWVIDVPTRPGDGNLICVQEQASH